VIKDYEIVTGVKFNFCSNLSTLNSFCNYLLIDRKVNNITLSKYVSTLKSILRHAAKHPYNKIINKQLLTFSAPRNDRHFEVVALTIDELKRIESLLLTDNRRLQKIKNIFLFSCYTGLRYGDIIRLQHHNIHYDEMMIKIYVEKTEKFLTIPITKPIKEILDQYSHEKRPLPKISNQKLNDAIKQLGKLAGLNEPVEKVRYVGAERKETVKSKWQQISSITGRKTFVSLSLEKGMSVPQVMSVSDHVDMRSLSRYIDVSANQKRKSMETAWN